MALADDLGAVADELQKTGQTKLHKQISEAEDAARDMARDKRRLEDKVEELQRALRFKEETVFRRPFYYLKQGDQTPYCPRCWEKDKQGVHVVVVWSEQGETRFDCPDCKNAYKVGTYRSQSHRQIEPDSDTY